MTICGHPNRNIVVPPCLLERPGYMLRPGAASATAARARKVVKSIVRDVDADARMNVVAIERKTE